MLLLTHSLVATSPVRLPHLPLTQEPVHLEVPPPPVDLHSLSTQVTNLEVSKVLDKVGQGHVELAVEAESQAQLLLCLLRDLHPVLVSLVSEGIEACHQTNPI